MQADGRDKTKIVYLEILRVIAIFFVIFNHTADNGFFLFSKSEPDSISFWLYQFISVFCKFSVPVFLAVSGAIMLGRDNELVRKWIARILRIVMILVVVSLGYYISDGWTTKASLSVGDYLKQLYSGGVKFHLWYLYLYIAYLMVLPLLRALVSKLEDKYFYYIFVLAIVYNGLFPCVEYLWNQGSIVMSGNIKASWVVSYIVLYPCLGYFMHHRLDRKRIRKMLPVVWAADILSIAVSCYMTYYKSVLTGVLNENESQGFFGSFVVINCVTIFITVKYLWEKSEIPLWLRKIIVSVGGCTFGIYLIHAKLVGSGLFIRGIEFLRNVGINQMLAAWILCFVVLAVSYMVTFVLSKIPVVRKVVGF